jgi:glycosyltransferase involved in cell wall biosynthesis
LPATLAAIERQSFDRSRYEVIVVDDGSTDRTAEIAHAHGASVVSLAANCGLAAARNAGVQAATAPAIAFTDDDCEPDHEWLATLAGALSDPSVDGVGGRVVAACPNDFLHRYLRARNPLTPLPAELLRSADPRYRLRLYLRDMARSRREPPPGAILYSVVGANMALRRELIAGLGGFDEAFGFGGEEQELCHRAHARPGRALFRYEPRAVVTHAFRPRLGDSLRRARAYGLGHARIALKHDKVRLILYPFPMLVASAIMLAALKPRLRAAVLAMLAPEVSYLSWPLTAWRTRSVEPLAYPYIQFAEELWTMAGELRGLRDGYEAVGDAHASEGW